MRRDPASARGVTSRSAIGMSGHAKPASTTHCIRSSQLLLLPITSAASRSGKGRNGSWTVPRPTLAASTDATFPEDVSFGRLAGEPHPTRCGRQLSAIGGRTVLRSVLILPDDAGRSGAEHRVRERSIMREPRARRADHLRNFDPGDTRQRRKTSTQPRRASGAAALPEGRSPPSLCQQPPQGAWPGSADVGFSEMQGENGGRGKD